MVRLFVASQQDLIGHSTELTEKGGRNSAGSLGDFLRMQGDESPAARNVVGFIS